MRPEDEQISLACYETSDHIVLYDKDFALKQLKEVQKQKKGIGKKTIMPLAVVNFEGNRTEYISAERGYGQKIFEIYLYTIKDWYHTKRVSEQGRRFLEKFYTRNDIEKRPKEIFDSELYSKLNYEIKWNGGVPDGLENYLANHEKNEELEDYLINGGFFEFQKNYIWLTDSEQKKK